MTQYTFFANTAKNIESLLADELKDLAIPEVQETRGGARFSGSLEEAYRVCLWSRVANRVFLPLANFTADSPEALYNGVQAIDWSLHLAGHSTFAVDCNVASSVLTHSHYAALKVKDAIVDQFRDRTGERPSIDTGQPALRINLHIYRNEATLSLDFSGDSLHRRAYREEGAAAPLKETLAAALLLRAGWPSIAQQGGSLVDPMCGSGTLPIEAAMIAGDIAPGLLRRYWGFTDWLGHDELAWQGLLSEAMRRRVAGLASIPPIRGYDHHPVAIRSALANLERADLVGKVHFEKCSLDALPACREGETGLVIVNPPYGERLGEDSELPALYAQLGATLKSHFTGWRAAVFTGNLPLAHQLGLRAVKKHALYNGTIECTLLHFDVTPEKFASAQRGPRPLALEERSEGAVMFANRLKKNIKNLGRWAAQHNITCYRLYDADMPEYAVAVDLYQGERLWVVVQEYEAPKTVDEKKARFRLREALSVIQEVLSLEVDQLHYKVRKRQKGAAQYERLATQQQFHEVEENGLRFEVNFADYLDTGLFLDHRMTRKLVGEQAQGKDFLNLFAYTGTATVYAAKGGARSTTTVDMSKTYLDWAERNMALNGFLGARHQFIQADCMQWLRDANRQKQRYGLIFLDPPSFSTSKRMANTFDVQRDHLQLLQDTLKLLTSDGVLIFSNNLRKFKLDREGLSNCEIEDMTARTLPKDFAGNPRIHQCFIIKSRTNQNQNPWLRK